MSQGRLLGRSASYSGWSGLLPAAFLTASVLASVVLLVASYPLLAGLLAAGALAAFAGSAHSFARSRAQLGRPGSAWAVSSLFPAPVSELLRRLGTYNPSRARKVASQLVGTWRLVEYEDYLPDGTIVRKFGDKPLGLFMYDATGHVALQISRSDRKQADGGSAADEASELLSGYSAYFGTYEVDEARSLVVHHVEASLKPAFLGTGLRPFKLDGDRLELGDGRTWRRVLVRVRPSPAQLRGTEAF